MDTEQGLLTDEEYKILKEARTNMKTGASLNRGNSKQDYCTPPEFILAVEVRFGRIQWDLAATKENQVTVGHFEGNFLGPGSELGEDSLLSGWPLMVGTVAWLNPPFADIAPWAKKCSTASESAWTLMLVPASIGTNWWAEHVHGKAMVYGLSPRLTFQGCTASYPKDLALCAYGYGAVGYTTWRWI